jgi:ATP-dependent RNA helicase DDX5/DBP2
VINYDFPTGVEDYVHRIGRTGRAGATGLAYTFLCVQDSKYAADLIKILEGADQDVPPELMDMVSRGGRGRKRNKWATRSARGGGDSRYGGRLESGRGGRGKDDYGGRSRFDPSLSLLCVKEWCQTFLFSLTGEKPQGVQLLMIPETEYLVSSK